MPSSIEWEILVVDNNSKDETRKVVEQFSFLDSKRYRYIFEPRQGKSFALNRGVHEASGDVLAFIDDDITVEPNWLFELTNRLTDSRWAGTGGRVYLPNNFSIPSWIAPEGNHSLLSILANFDLGPDVQVLSTPPIGNNMAFRKEVFVKHGLFRTDLGPQPGSEIRHEDTEFGSRVMSGGETILYVPTAVVRHAVEERRLEKRYFLAYHFDYGRALIRERGNRGKMGIIPRSFISLLDRSLKMLPKKTWWWIRETDPQKRFFNKCHAWAMAGQVVELYRRCFESSDRQKESFSGESNRQGATKSQSI